MSAVIARILLRVLAGFLIGHGLSDFADAINADPAIAPALAEGLQVVGGLIVWAAAEGWYWLAKRFGWAT